MHLIRQSRTVVPTPLPTIVNGLRRCTLACDPPQAALPRQRSQPPAKKWFRPQPVEWDSLGLYHTNRRGGYGGLARRAEKVTVGDGAAVVFVSPPRCPPRSSTGASRTAWAAGHFPPPRQVVWAALPGCVRRTEPRDRPGGGTRRRRVSGRDPGARGAWSLLGAGHGGGTSLRGVRIPHTGGCIIAGGAGPPQGGYVTAGGAGLLT